MGGENRERRHGPAGILRKAAASEKKNENQVYSILSILLDQALGELSVMRYVDGLEILDAPGSGAGIRLDRLSEYVAAEFNPEGWAFSGDLEAACERYTTYRGNPSQEEDWPLRADVYAGATCCLPILSG